MLICHAASRAHRGPAVSEGGHDQKGAQRREDSAEAGRIARGTPSVLRNVTDREAVSKVEIVGAVMDQLVHLYELFFRRDKSVSMPLNSTSIAGKEQK